MADIVIGAGTNLIPWQGQTTNLEARIYPLRGFVAADGTVLPSSSPHGGSFFYRATLTHSNGALSIGAVTLKSTTDAIDHPVDGTYGLFVFSTTTKRILAIVTGYEHFRLSHLQSPTTWAAIRDFNLGTQPAVSLRDSLVGGDLTASGYRGGDGTVRLKQNTVVQGNLSATSFSGNGAGITGIVAAGVGGSSSTGALSQVADTNNAGGAARRIAGSLGTGGSATEVYVATDDGFQVRDASGVMRSVVLDNDARLTRELDAVIDFAASGSSTTTTGTVSAASTALTVASTATFRAPRTNRFGVAVKQGILIKGAGGVLRSGTNGVTTNGTASMTGTFDSHDVGKMIVGTGIPANTYILSVQSATAATLSANATATATGVSYTLYKNHTTTVEAIAGSVITLGVAASRAVSGAVVQHDDSAAINNALAFAHNAKGGRVVLRAWGAGHYRTAAPVVSAVNGIIGFPQIPSTSGNPIRVELVGEVRGQANTPVPGGVVIDATDAEAGTGTAPALIAGRAYTVAPFYTFQSSDWNDLDFFTDNINYIVPANPSISGIQMANALRANIGDNVGIFAVNFNTAAGEPTNFSVGLWMPQQVNNIFVTAGSAQIVGFQEGMRVADHTRLSLTTAAFCKIGMKLMQNIHPVIGSVCLENNEKNIVVDSAATDASVDLHVQIERSFPSAGWWETEHASDLIDTNSALAGQMSYRVLRPQYPDRVPLGVTGAGGVELINLDASKGAPAIHWWRMNESSGTNVPALFGPAGTTNAAWTALTAMWIGTYLEFNGTSHYLNSNAAIPFASTPSATFCFWMRPDNPASTTAQILVEAANAGANASTAAGTFFAYLDSGMLYVGRERKIVRAIAPPAGVQVHVAITMNSGRDKTAIGIHYNGVEQPTYTTLNNAVVNPDFADTIIYVGARNSASFFYDGMIDDFRIYRQELRPTGIRAVMSDRL